MHRREAIEALLALPAIERIARLELKPDDVIVVECNAALSQTAVEQIQTLVGEVFPDRKVLICDQAMRLKVMPGSAA